MSISSCEGSTIVVLAIHKHNEEVGPKFYEVSTWILFDQKCPIYVSICPQNAGVDRRTLFSFSPPYFRHEANGWHCRVHAYHFKTVLVHVHKYWLCTDFQQWQIFGSRHQLLQQKEFFQKIHSPANWSFICTIQLVSVFLRL